MNKIETLFEDVNNLIVFIVFGTVNAAGLILNTLCFILFIYETMRKNEYFATAFFYILNIGYLLDMIALVLLLATVITQNEQVATFQVAIQQYSIFYLGPWNTLMALNRFTAICFWKQHNFLWKHKILLATIILTLIYPFIIGGYFLFDSYCLLHPVDIKNCLDATQIIIDFSIISNGINVIITVALGLSTAIASRLKLVTLNPETKKFGNFLFMQSIISLILFGGCACIHLFYFKAGSKTSESSVPTFKVLLSLLTSFYFVYFRVSSTVLLLILSKTIRKSFANFYFCKRLWQKINEKRRIQPVTVLTSIRTTQL